MSVPYEKAVEEDLNLGTSTATVTMPGGGTDTGTQINLATFAIGPTAATWDPGSIAANASEEKEVTVTGAALGDLALCSFSLDITTLTLTCAVSATNTVTATLHNNGAGAVNLGSGTLTVLVFKVA